MGSLIISAVDIYPLGNKYRFFFYGETQYVLLEEDVHNNSRKEESLKIREVVYKDLENNTLSTNSVGDETSALISEAFRKQYPSMFFSDVEKSECGSGGPHLDDVLSELDFRAQ